MPKDFLANIADHYDVAVIGSGLAGMTAANILARQGRSVILLEQHYKLGGMATWFRRPGGHIFDVSLHGFPHGMIKSCRRYWCQEIADAIVPLENMRFDNPMFSLTTKYDREDFTRLLTERFGIPQATVVEFFDTVRKMNFYDDQTTTTRQMFDRFFPGRNDVVRLLMEPIVYANGSTLEDPAITYGIVFSNFMAKGVYTYQGGTDHLIQVMQNELKKNGVDVRIRCPVNRIRVEAGRVTGVEVGNRTVSVDAVVSNSNIKTTVLQLVGESHFDDDFLEETRSIRLNNSSTQVYMALGPDERIDESTGDLLFSSTAREFKTDLLLSRDITSRTYSFYYPRTRPQGRPRCLVVSSTNAHYDDWAHLSRDDYEASKSELIDSTLDHVDRYVPNIRQRLDHVEA
jgi:phytoene dehydrogenase-like protein